MKKIDSLWAQLPDIIDVPYEVNNCEAQARLMVYKHGIYYAYMENGRDSSSAGVAYSYYGYKTLEEAIEWMGNCLKKAGIING